MSDATKVTYPRMPERNWWDLRDKFKQTMPRKVTPSYLSSALGNMTDASAKSNIIRPLRVMGLIDDEGDPTERAKRWRDDHEYPEVCNEILNEIYPQDLLDALPPPSPNRDSLARWFANKTGSGTGGSRQMAAFYALLAAADPNGRTQPQTTTQRQPRDKVHARQRSRKPVENRGDQSGSEQQDGQYEAGDYAGQNKTGLLPGIHIDLQIHIHPEASVDQIDQIFASMARHLYSGNGANER